MDKTIVDVETLDELADLAGLREPITAITARSVSGEVDFAAALRERVALLNGLPADACNRTVDRIHLVAGAKILVATMKANGAFTALVSGSFRLFTRHVRDQCGFDREAGNDPEIHDGRFTGHLVEPILDRRTKLEILVRLAAERQVPLAQCLAVGDGANDLGMIQAAGLGVAFHPRPAVAAQARHQIRHNDLTALLFAQGYAEDEFIR
jgi:phosphoserine phosphatase